MDRELDVVDLCREATVISSRDKPDLGQCHDILVNAFDVAVEGAC